MSDLKGEGKPVGRFAQRIDPTKDSMTPAQLEFIKRAEIAQWSKKCQKLRTRNRLTGFAIGGVVMAISDGYTFYSVSQERIMDELDAEANVAARIRNAKTGAN